MNERTNELKSQAYQYADRNTQDGDNMFATLQLEKFAELIVRECLSIIQNNNPRPPGTVIMYNSDQDQYFDTGWQVAVETKEYQIKKHFGVEE